MHSRRRIAFSNLLVATVLVILAGCATVPLDWPRSASEALPQSSQTALSRQFAERSALHPGSSGFHVLKSGAEAADARAALADAAQKTLDLQYFIVQNDVTTALLLGHIVSAAQRGVRVRILLDDLHGSNRDFAMAAAAADPRIEVRLFNPFLQRGAGRATMLPRLFDLVAYGERLNQRMHIKLWIADNAAGIFGGRNLGDEYFDAGADANFSDLDLLTVGPLVAELSHAFDDYWNSKWAVPIAAFVDLEPGRDVMSWNPPTPGEAQAAESSEVGRALASGDFLKQLRGGDLALVWAPAYAFHDDATEQILADSHLSHMGPRVRASLESVQSEIILISPYFVPSEHLLQFLADVRRRGVRVVVLTNSLASTDSLPAQAGYARYRADMLRSGIELFEMRPYADTSHSGRLHRWVQAQASSLHAKALIVDRRIAFVGSMNFDPRSRLHNYELLVGVDSAELASELADLFDESIEADHAFRVLLRNPDQKSDALMWVTEEKGREVRYESEPLASFFRRVWSGVFGIMVPEHLL